MYKVNGLISAAFFCDCQELDDTFDRLIMRAKIPEKRCEAILGVIEDRLRIPWPRGAIKVPIDSVTPLVLVPGMFIFASQSWLTQVLVHGMVLPLLIFCKYQNVSTILSASDKILCYV